MRLSRESAAREDKIRVAAAQRQQQQQAETEAAAAIKAAEEAASAKQRQQMQDSLRAVFANGAPVAVPSDMVHSWTQGFSQELDRGAFGIVYKGVICYRQSNTKNENSLLLPLEQQPPQQQQQQPDKALYVAVKNINTEAVVVSLAAEDADSVDLKRRNTKSLMQAVAREINILSSFRHPNIIRLIGYCLPSEQERNISARAGTGTGSGDGGLSKTSLVYEYACRGGLHKVLAEESSAAELTWHYRVRVALGVAKGLSYMHYRDAGRPAYHRDIKAANIALTQSFVPKIIDCGLAKYIPEQGAVAAAGALMSINTATGARFGTVGYMCPKYSKKSDMPYDAKCEVFSFGIVLLELLTGNMQNRPDLLDDLLDEGEENIVPDVRAGDWPLDTVQHMLALAAECIAPYGKRRDSMRSIAQALGVIDALHPVSSLESSLLKSHTLLAEEVERLRLQRDVDDHCRIAEQEKVFECCVCYDEFVLSKGVLCSGHSSNGGGVEQHFFCNSDLSDMVCSQCSDMGNFVRFGCKSVCCMCLAIPVPLGEPQVQSEFNIETLGAHATAEALGAFLLANRRAVEELSERKRVAELERAREQHADELQALREKLIEDKAVKLEASSQRHRLRIVNDILTLKCPHCEVAMFDFDGCFAVEHRADGNGPMQQGCGRYFCGWCLAPFEGSQACHAHVKICDSAPARHKGSYYGRMTDFNTVQAETRKKKVLQYLLQHVPEEDTKAKVREILARDLADLNIRL